MTLVSPGTLVNWPGILDTIDATPAFGSDGTLDAAGEYLAYIFQAAEDMTISHVGWRTGSVVANPTADTRIETVGADGLPTGTLWAATTNLVSGTLTSNTNTLHALTASATILRGDIFAAKIVYNSGTSLIVHRINGLAHYAQNIPYRVTNVSGAAVKSSLAIVSMPFAFGNSTTTFYSVRKALPMTTITTGSFNNATAGDKRGMRFQVPMDSRCVGLTFWLGTNAGDFVASVQDDSGNELSSSAITYEGDRSGLSTAATLLVYFDNAVSFTRGTWYRATVEPNSATNTAMAFVTLPSSDYRSAWPGLSNIHYTSYTTAGGWVDSGTNTIALMDVILDQVDDGTGSGSSGGVGRSRVAGGF